MGIDFKEGCKSNETKHMASNSNSMKSSIYLKQCDNLYQFHVRRCRSSLNVSKRLFVSNINKHPRSLSRIVRFDLTLSPPPGMTHSHSKPFVWSKGRKFWKAIGRRNNRGFRA
ncbi:unnamed protein product [Linum tenue]|uniref:Large ribosomal subunit protein uL15/eL18 domain-containing protein n=1 Tax=Linum tenue TaxID=586396 RepID=A0AAV0KHB3_9ROSI|nr:unnamed protein product [Linum tenue]